MIYFLSLRSLVNGCGGQFPTLVIANAVRRAAIHLSPKGITDSFTLRVQNDKPISHCGAGVLWTPLRSRSTDRAGRRDRRKACGNPFHTPRHCEHRKVRGNPFHTPRHCEHRKVRGNPFFCKSGGGFPRSLCRGLRRTPAPSE